MSATKNLITHTDLKISRAQFLDGIYRLYPVMFIFRESSSYLIVSILIARVTDNNT